MNIMLVLAAALTADFGQDVCKMRPEIHSSGFGPTICSLTQQALDDVKSMGFMYARTHDWALTNPNQRVCDYFHIFPLMHLDAKATAGVGGNRSSEKAGNDRGAKGSRIESASNRSAGADSLRRKRMTEEEIATPTMAK